MERVNTAAEVRRIKWEGVRNVTKGRKIERRDGKVHPPKNRGLRLTYNLTQRV